MRVNFSTPTKISILDVISMGDSCKRGDSKTIGQFDSGLKYSIALLLRDNVDLKITTYQEGLIENRFGFTTKLVEDTDTGKSKELICIVQNEGEPVETGFAKNLGYNWETWMALRELWSNMLDEGGSISEESSTTNGTVITLDFKESCEFYECWENKHLYINEIEPLFEVSSSVEALENKEGYVRIYKQNILVYENKEKTSQYAWNIKFGEIDERRILSNVSSIKDSIAGAMSSCKNKDFLKTIITKEFLFDKDDFFDSAYNAWGVSDEVNDIATEIFEEFGEVYSYDWLMSKIRERKDCKIKGKIIRTVSDSLWSYSSDIHIESKPEVITITKDTVQDRIEEVYNFKVDVDVKTAVLRGSTVVADKYEQCLIISEDFSVEKDFGKFLVEYLTLTKEGNIITNLTDMICELIKK